MENAVLKAIADHRRVIDGLEALVPEIERAGQRIVECLEAGGKVLWMGNGGSAADSQHMAAELVGRFQRERRGLASIALTTDTSILTSVANDYGYDRVFERQVQALCREGDVVVGLSTSGKSPNVVRALEAAGALGAWRLGMTGGDGGAMKESCESCLVVPSDVTARIQEGHILIGHAICDLVESAIAARGEG